MSADQKKHSPHVLRLVQVTEKTYKIFSLITLLLSLNNRKLQGWEGQKTENKLSCTVSRRRGEGQKSEVEREDMGLTVWGNQKHRMQTKTNKSCNRNQSLWRPEAAFQRLLLSWIQVDFNSHALYNVSFPTVSSILCGWKWMNFRAFTLRVTPNYRMGEDQLCLKSWISVPWHATLPARIHSEFDSCWETFTLLLPQSICYGDQGSLSFTGMTKGTWDKHRPPAWFWPRAMGHKSFSKSSSTKKVMVSGRVSAQTNQLFSVHGK